MTANQLTQGRTNTTTPSSKARKSITPVQRSSTTASRTSTPNLRKSHVPQGANRRISVASATSSAIASPTPPPQSPDISRHSYVSSVDGGEDEALHHRLHRLLGDAISQAPDESVMRLQQLQLRVEVLEAENKFLKLENAQNKSAEQILEKSLLLKKKNGDVEDTAFALDGQQAIADELKTQLEESQQKWEAEKTRLEESKQKLTTQIDQLNQEREQWNSERDNSETRVRDIEREKERMESKMRELEEKLAVSEANAATAIAQQAASSKRPLTEDDMDGSYSEEMYDQRRRLEAEMEDVHEKMANLTEAMRAKDMFLQNMSEQVEIHRNMCEEKEREIRRIKSDIEREKRDKDRLLDEVSDLETRLRQIDDSGEAKNQLEKKNRELEESMRRLDREKRDLSDQLERSANEKKESEEEYQMTLRRLEQTVEELKKAGFESLELYESSMEIHKIEMEKFNAILAEERRKMKMIDAEREELRKAGLDAIEVYESTINDMKSQNETEAVQHEERIKRLQDEASDLRKQIDQLVNASQGGKDEEVEKIKLVWESERKRLEDQVESANQRLHEQQQQYQAMRQENERTADSLKQMEKFAAEKDNLEARLKEYEQDYEELNKLRNKSLEDIGSAIEAQKKAEAENRALQDGIHKLKRDLELQTETMATLRQDKDLLESAAESGSGASEEQELRLINLQQQVEKLEAQNQLVIKQKEQLALTVEQLEQSKANQLQASKSATTSKEDQRRIKELVNKAEKYEEEIASLRHSVTDTKKEFETLTDDNKKLNAEYEKLLEAHRSVENECLKLMDEVERLHSEGLMGLDANIHDGHDGANNQEHKEDPRLIVLQKQYAEKQTQLDRITVQHTAQLREVQQKLNDLERNKQREVHALNKDIAELESLIESKIFKEADLEEAVESERKTVRRLRDELSDLKNQLKESSSAKTNGKTSERKSSTTTSTSLRTPPAPTSNTANKANDTNDTLYCEICEQHGHDIISCTALLSDADYAAEEKRVSNSVNTDRDRPVRVVTEEVLWSFCI
jgi:chromosome segregation ATPase